MEKRWVNITGKILIVLGAILFIADLVFSLMDRIIGGGSSNMGMGLAALGLFISGIIIIGFNNVLQKLDELNEGSPTKRRQEENSYTNKTNKRSRKQEKIDNFDDYKYVSRK